MVLDSGQPEWPTASPSPASLAAAGADGDLPPELQASANGQPNLMNKAFDPMFEAPNGLQAMFNAMTGEVHASVGNGAPCAAAAHHSMVMDDAPGMAVMGSVDDLLASATAASAPSSNAGAAVDHMMIVDVPEYADGDGAVWPLPVEMIDGMTQQPQQQQNDDAVGGTMASVQAPALPNEPAAAAAPAVPAAVGAASAEAAAPPSLAEAAGRADGDEEGAADGAAACAVTPPASIPGMAADTGAATTAAGDGKDAAITAAGDGMDAATTGGDGAACTVVGDGDAAAAAQEAAAALQGVKRKASALPGDAAAVHARVRRMPLPDPKEVRHCLLVWAVLERKMEGVPPLLPEDEEELMLPPPAFGLGQQQQRQREQQQREQRQEGQQQAKDGVGVADAAAAGCATRSDDAGLVNALGWDTLPATTALGYFHGPQQPLEQKEQQVGPKGQQQEEEGRQQQQQPTQQFEQQPGWQPSQQFEQQPDQQPSQQQPSQQPYQQHEEQQQEGEQQQQNAKLTLEEQLELLTPEVRRAWEDARRLVLASTRRTAPEYVAEAAAKPKKTEPAPWDGLDELVEAADREKRRVESLKLLPEIIRIKALHAIVQLLDERVAHATIQEIYTYCEEGEGVSEHKISGLLKQLAVIKQEPLQKLQPVQAVVSLLPATVESDAGRNILEELGFAHDETKTEALDEVAARGEGHLSALRAVGKTAVHYIEAGVGGGGAGGGSTRANSSAGTGIRGHSAASSRTALGGGGGGGGLGAGLGAAGGGDGGAGLGSTAESDRAMADRQEGWDRYRMLNDAMADAAKTVEDVKHDAMMLDEPDRVPSPPPYARKRARRSSPLGHRRQLRAMKELLISVSDVREILDEYWNKLGDAAARRRYEVLESGTRAERERLRDEAADELQSSWKLLFAPRVIKWQEEAEGAQVKAINESTAQHHKQSFRSWKYREWRLCLGLKLSSEKGSRLNPDLLATMNRLAGTSQPMLSKTYARQWLREQLQIPRWPGQQTCTALKEFWAEKRGVRGPLSDSQLAAADYYFFGLEPPPALLSGLPDMQQEGEEQPFVGGDLTTAEAMAAAVAAAAAGQPEQALQQALQQHQQALQQQQEEGFEQKMATAAAVAGEEQPMSAEQVMTQQLALAQQDGAPSQQQRQQQQAAPVQYWPDQARAMLHASSAPMSTDELQRQLQPLHLVQQPRNVAGTSVMSEQHTSVAMVVPSVQQQQQQQLQQALQHQAALHEQQQQQQAAQMAAQDYFMKKQLEEQDASLQRAGGSYPYTSFPTFAAPAAQQDYSFQPQQHQYLMEPFMQQHHHHLQQQQQPQQLHSQQLQQLQQQQQPDTAAGGPLQAPMDDVQQWAQEPLPCVGAAAGQPQEDGGGGLMDWQVMAAP